ncbi:MAG: PQQ-binding-like beta-propeller repeat protein [Armatimonadota bacterium]
MESISPPTIGRFLLPACLLVLSLLVWHCALAADELLCPFETTDGLSLTWGQNLKGHLDLSTNKTYVTEGTQALRLWGEVSPEAKGNSYLGVRIDLAGPVDLRRKLILLDAATSTPEVTRAMYLRAYDDKGRRALSYVNWNSPLGSTPRTFQFVPGLGGGGFTWEPKEITPDADRTRVVAFELLIGTPDPGVTMDAFFDNLRVQETDMKAWQDVTSPKPLVRETSLVVAGNPASLVVAPPGDEWASAAHAFIDAVAQATGITLALRQVASVPELVKQGKMPYDAADTTTNLDASLWGGAPPQVDGVPVTPVLLGNVADTAALLYLYSHDYCAPDHFYPGAGGYEVRTVHDPWGKGINALVLGCSDAAGAAAAIEALRPSLAQKAKPGTLVLPPTLLVRLTGEATRRYGSLVTTSPAQGFLEREKEIAERELSTGVHTGLWSHVANVGQNYVRSGHSDYARAFVWLVKRAYEHYQSKPGTYGGPWGMDADFTIHRVIPAWDGVEEDPSITDEERWEVTQILHQWVSEDGLPKAAGTVASTVPRHNHQTFPALGLLYAADYFGKYYATFDSQEWLATADACFGRQARMFKPHEDCNGYQWLTLGHLAHYCLARPAFAYFQPSPLWDEALAAAAAPRRLWGTVSNAERDADYAVLGMDSFGYSTTYGDTGAYVGWWSELEFLHRVNFVLRDAGYQWVIQKKVERSGRQALGQYAVILPAEEPLRLSGAVAFPLDGNWWKAYSGEDAPPLTSAVDKVVLRHGFAEDSGYVLLDALNPGGHRHYDGNSVSRWCARGRIWLADADYFRAEPQVHSTVIVLRDGLATALPNLARCGHVANLPNLGVSETILEKYNGVDWHRWLFLLKDGTLLVADRFVARRAGDYSFRVYWQLLGDLQTGESWADLHQAGQWVRLAFPADAHLIITDDEACGRNWAGYPYIERPVVHCLRAIYDARLKEGQEFVAWALLQTAGAERATSKLRRGGSRVAVVEGMPASAPLALGLGCTPPAVRLEETPAAWVLADGRLVAIDAQNRDLEVNLATGEGVALAPAGTEPDLLQKSAQFREAGLRARVPQVTQALQRLAVPKPPQVEEEPVLEAKVKWRLRERPKIVVLTNNREPNEPTVDLLDKIEATPAPLEANIFGGAPGRNLLKNVLDGRLSGTDDCVMWSADQLVTLTLSFVEEIEPKELDLRAWWASSSSKNAKFQIATIEVELSSDGFKTDVRPAGKLTDDAEHANWGGSPQRPETYVVPLTGGKARQVRVRLTPRPGTAIYLSELYLRGSTPSLTDEAAARPVRGMPYFTCLASVEEVRGVTAGRSDGEVFLFDPEGRVLWQQKLAHPVRAIATVHFDGSAPVIVAGCREGLIVALDHKGGTLWQVQLERYKNTPHVNVVLAADFSSEGRETAIVGADNWRYYAIDGTGKLLWHYESVHVATAACAADLTGDGVDEVVLGTNYYWWSAVKADGSRLWGYSTKSGPECTAIAIGDLNGDGGREVVFAAGDGSLQCVGADGKLLWMVYLGDRATALACTDVDKDGKDELLVASANCLAYCLGDEGTVRWRLSTGQPIITARLTANGLWACGCQDGSTLMLGAADGRIVSRGQLAGEVSAICTAGADVYVATTLGETACLEGAGGD